MEAMFSEIQRRIDKIKRSSISEADTQAILVEPILSFAGFDVSNVFEVKRSESDVDLKVYKGGNLLIGIEVKRVGSDEFNICKEGKEVSEEVGKLTFNEEKKKYENEPGDGVGQLRRYALESEPRVAILTNGVKWGVFKDVEAFIENPQKPLSPDFFKKSSNFECFDIENMGDFKRLIKFLRELIF